MSDLQQPEGQPVLITTAPYSEATPRGPITGAWIMGQLDIAAGLAGQQASGGDALMISIKDLTFHAPLLAGVEFAVHATLTRTGNTSFNLSFSGWADPKTTCTRIFSADVLLVAVDAEGKPRKIV
jgi:acyl-CoA thioesterase YciA